MAIELLGEIVAGVKFVDDVRRQRTPTPKRARASCRLPLDQFDHAQELTIALNEKVARL